MQLPEQTAMNQRIASFDWHSVRVRAQSDISRIALLDAFSHILFLF